MFQTKIMLNNNHKNSTCTFAEPLISYLYGEIGVAEKAEFEAHLGNCSSCGNELAEFGFARSAVQEWKINEFDVLPTPAFAIPSNSAKTRLIVETKRSWLENFKGFFTFRPALAMSALAVLIVFAGIALFTVSFTDNINLAGRIDNKNAIVTAVTPTIEKVDKPPTQLADKNPAQVDNKSTAPFTLKPKNMSAAVSGKKSSAPIDSILKVSVNAPKNNSGNAAPLPDIKPAERPGRKLLSARKSKVPSLTETEETEDNSVRLADLFDELDTK